MKKITSLVLSLIMLITMLPLQAAAQAELLYMYTPEEEFEFNLFGDNMIERYLGNREVIRIPPEIGGVPVKGIKSIFIPEYNDEGIPKGDESITKIVVPEGVEYIGEGAFQNCPDLTTLELPDTLTYIGYNSINNTKLFDDKSNWKDYCLYVDNYLLGINTMEYYDEDDGILEEIRVKPGTRIIAGNDGGGYKYWEAKNLYLPRSIVYIGRDTIEQYARGDEGLGWGVVNQKEHTGVGYIGHSVIGKLWSDSSEAMNIDIKPGTEVIPEAFFRNRFNQAFHVGSVITPKSLKIIPYNCFEGEMLVKARLPYVEKIQDSAFSGCSAMHTLQLSEDLTEIGKNAFYYCSKLETVEIFGKVKKIGNSAFFGCNKLNNIVIHEGVENIASNAFAACWGLKNVYYTGSESAWKAAGYDCFSDVTVHYNYVPQKRSYEDPIYIPQTINEVTITGKGTAYGSYRVFDAWGNPAKDMLVEYTANDRGIKKTFADKNGFIKVSIAGIEEDEDFTIKIGGIGIAPQEQILSVTVEPLSFTADYEAVFTKGASVGIGIGAGASVGELEADATIAEVGASGSVERGISVSQEYIGGKNKLTVSSKQNLEGALEAKAGLFAGVETDLGVNVKASLGDVYGNGSVGSTAGVSFEDEDFDINNKEDVEGVAKFVLCAILDTMGSNSVAREIIRRMGFEINAYEAGNTASLGAGASLGVVGITGDYADAGITLGGINASSVWSNSTKTYADGTVKYTSSLKAGTDGKVFDFGIKSKGDSNISLGEAVFKPEKLSNNVKLSAKRDSSNALVDLSLICTDAQSDNILWNKSSAESRHTITYPPESVENITHNDWNIYSFSMGSKAFFSVDEWENAVGVMLNSGEKATYNVSKSVEKGVDLELSGTVKLLAEIGGKIGVSGVESYEYDSSNGIYENGEVFIQSSNDIESEVKEKVITISKLVDMAEEKIQEMLSEMFDTVKESVGGAIDAGQQKLEYIGDGIYAAIKKTKEDLAPAAVFAIELMSDGETAAKELITVGNPCIITTNDADGNVISDFSGSAMLLTMAYTDEQLLASEVSNKDAIKLMRWDENLCAYAVIDAQHNQEDMSFSAYITKPGQYVLACDVTPPAVTDFTYNTDNANPELRAVISDASGISEFSLVINDGKVCGVQGLYDYYDSTTGQFAYPLSDFEDGGYSACIKVTDSFGNTAEEWADFEIYRQAPEVTAVIVPETLNPASEIRASVSSYDGLSDVYLNSEYIDEEGETITQYTKMTENYDSETGENYYVAKFHEIEAGKDVDIWISAYNYNGNCAQSAKTAVRTSPVAIEIDEVLKNCVSVVCSNKIGLENGVLYAAAYDAGGALINAQRSGVSDNVLFTELPEEAVIKAFLWNGDMTPICEETLYLEAEEE